MRGSRRAYDPHLAACATRPPFVSCVVRAGSTPPLVGGLSGELTPSILGWELLAPFWECTPRLRAGGSVARLRQSGYDREHSWVWAVRVGEGSRVEPGLVWGGA